MTFTDTLTVAGSQAVSAKAPAIRSGLPGTDPQQVRGAAVKAASRQQVQRRVTGRPSGHGRQVLEATAREHGITLPVSWRGRRSAEHSGASARPTPERAPAVPEANRPAPARGVLADRDRLWTAVHGDGTTGPATSDGQVLARLGLTKDKGNRARLKAAAKDFGIALPTRHKDGAAVGESVLDEAERVIAAHAAAGSLKDMCIALGLAVSGKTYNRIREALARYDLPALDRSSQAELAAARIELLATSPEQRRAAFTGADSIAAALETLGHPATAWGYRWAAEECARLGVPRPTCSPVQITAAARAQLAARRS